MSRMRVCRYCTELQSHLPEFDYLKSLEIEEKINKIRWCRSYNSSKLLLSTNDKTIKLWRVSHQKLKHVSNFNFAVSSKPGAELTSKSVISDHKSRQSSLIRAFRDDTDLDLSQAALRLPKVVTKENVIHTKNMRVFSNAHAYHINSISVNSDQETFLSADDLRINLWNLEVTHTSFNIVDLKPESMEDLTEVITCAECHPENCALFAYSSSKGLSRLVDMRQRALCDYDDSAILFESPEDPQNHSLFSEIVNSISDMKFSGNGRYLLTRDYLTLKIWDLAMHTHPVQVFNVHDHLRGKLYDLYECDRIFDKFTCCLSHDGQHAMTGTYDGYFRVFGLNDGTDSWVNVNAEDPNFEEKHHREAAAPSGDVDVTNLSLADNIYQMAWHPHADVAAIAASNSFYVFSAQS